GPRNLTASLLLRHRRSISRLRLWPRCAGQPSQSFAFRAVSKQDVEWDRSLIAHVLRLPKENSPAAIPEHCAPATDDTGALSSEFRRSNWQFSDIPCSSSPSRERSSPKAQSVAGTLRTEFLCCRSDRVFQE